MKVAINNKKIIGKKNVTQHQSKIYLVKITLWSTRWPKIDGSDEYDGNRYRLEGELIVTCALAV